jgi:hypothetical protein
VEVETEAFTTRIIEELQIQIANYSVQPGEESENPIGVLRIHCNLQCKTRLII